MDILMEENLDLVAQIEDMIVVFEQYMKVAALKKKVDKINSPLDSDDDSEPIGADVPEMDEEGRTILHQDSIVSRTMYD